MPKKTLKSFIPGAVALILFSLFLGIASKGFFNGDNGDILQITQPVLAQEIYPLFLCPCCGKSIEVECCGMAKQRKAFVDGLIVANLTENEVITAYINKYGLNSFIDEERKTAFKEQLVLNAPEDRPIIEISPVIYDLGDVSQSRGVTSTLFTIINQGQSDLIINKMETSCGCTSASIIYNNQEGPLFSMPGHGVNEKVGDWQINIPAGQNAILKIYYDPNMHGDFTGIVIREIHIFSNDPIDFEKKVTIELNQIK